MFDTTDNYSDRLRAIRHNLDIYVTLGLLDDQEVQQIRDLTTQANQAVQFASHSQSVAAAMAESSIAELIAAGPVDDAAVAQVASTLIVPASLDLAAGELYRQSITAAWELLRGKRDKLPTTLNKAFTDIRKQAEKLAPHVRPLEDAAAALRAGKGDQWLKLEDLMGVRSSLLSAILMLRRDHLLFESRRDNEGYARFRHPEPPAGYQQATPSKQFFANVLDRVDWVPADQAEIDATRKADKETAHA